MFASYLTVFPATVSACRESGHIIVDFTQLAAQSYACAIFNSKGSAAVHSYCNNGRSQMKWFVHLPLVSQNRNFGMVFSNSIKTPFGGVELGRPFLQKELVAVMFTGSPFIHVKSNIEDCVAPTYTPFQK